MAAQREQVSVTTPAIPRPASFELAVEIMDMLEDEYDARLEGLQLGQDEVEFSIRLPVAKILDQSEEPASGRLGTR